MPYISVNSATRNALNTPIARQSRLLRGWKKLTANSTNNAVFRMTSGHSPYAASAMTTSTSLASVYRWPAVGPC